MAGCSGRSPRRPERLAAFKVAAVVIGGVAITLGCFVEPLEINFMVGQAFANRRRELLPAALHERVVARHDDEGRGHRHADRGLCALIAAALTNFSTLALDKGPMGKVFAAFAPLNGFWAPAPAAPDPQRTAGDLDRATRARTDGSRDFQGDRGIRARRHPHEDAWCSTRPKKLGLKQEYIQEHAAGAGH